MPPTRAWSLSRQNLTTLNNAFTILQQLRSDMAADPAYAGNVPDVDLVLELLTPLRQLIIDHLAAEGK